MSDHAKTLEDALHRVPFVEQIEPRHASNYVSVPRLDLRAVLEEHEKYRLGMQENCDLRLERAALLEENKQLQAEVQSDIEHTAEWHQRWECLRKWSARWKKLAQFRGWPESRHEHTRQEHKRLRAAIVEWGREESLPDCVACVVFDAALRGNQEGKP